MRSNSSALSKKLGSGVLKHNPRKLILPSLDWTRPKDPPMSLGQAAIIANLKRCNVTVYDQSLSVNHSNFKTQQVTDFVFKHASKETDFAIGSFVWNEKYIKEILAQLKEGNFAGRIILGGPQVSYVKRNIEKYYPEVDIFIRGYAEEALAELMTSDEENPEITGVHYKGQPDKGLSAIADLEKTPSPFLTGIIKPQRFIRFETQRGCPFRCAFCQHRESDPSKTRRSFALPRIMQEIDWITQNKVIQDVAILDPTFNSGSQYMQVIERFIEGKYSGKLALQIRLEMITEEFLDKIEELNKTAIVVLEGGIQTIHKNEQKLIDRPNNMKKIARVLEDIKDRKIQTELSLIFGLPSQTVKSFQESVDFCKSFEVDKVYAFPLMILRGTPLFDMKKTLEILESDEINLDAINRIQSDIPHVISSFSFNYQDWQEMAKIAQDLEEYNNKPKNSVQKAKIEQKSELLRK
jgi:radical SAM superfamily enzyme YgiQ (UPF0313 family)